MCFINYVPQVPLLVVLKPAQRRFKGLANNTQGYHLISKKTKSRLVIL